MATGASCAARASTSSMVLPAFLMPMAVSTGFGTSTTAEVFPASCFPGFLQPPASRARSSRACTRGRIASPPRRSRLVEPGYGSGWEGQISTVARLRSARVLGVGGLLSRHLPDHEARPAQLDMAGRVMACLEEGTRLVVEAGTGTGKTLAYLVPAVLSDLKLVISTGTHTLQEQIVTRDIPLLGRVLDTELQVACMKGIGNYLCLRRLHERRRLENLMVPDPLWLRLEAWSRTTGTGDRGELEGLPDDAPLWAEVSPTTDTRIGPRCAFYDDCFVTAMRRRAAAARIVVVNHHLLLADLVLRATFPDAGVIPPYEALILDEAHSIEDIATTFFGRGISNERCATLVRDLRRAAVLEDDRGLLAQADHVLESSAELFHLLSGALPVAASARPRATGSASAARRSKAICSSPTSCWTRPSRPSSCTSSASPASEARSWPAWPAGRRRCGRRWPCSPRSPNGATSSGPSSGDGV